MKAHNAAKMDPAETDGDADQPRVHRTISEEVLWQRLK
jgi:hypothetical protein